MYAHVKKDPLKAQVNLMYFSVKEYQKKTKKAMIWFQIPHFNQPLGSHHLLSLGRISKNTHSYLEMLLQYPPFSKYMSV